ncbi:glycosyltransferase [uncultured Mucilaginibacter sp.]|uniref:glycosyltransferase family 2 protein n=1 Tax=uncultured Mucilaginibacter sp. TaxID=797541 RepID=UPI0025E036C6|nr:glycosyltransferase [uncultured Mucilaginibacter sp.]
MAVSIDVVIPSFRLDERYLLPILKLNVPAYITVNYYIIADNPKVKVPDAVWQQSQLNNVHLIINEHNLGFSKTRNKGIDAGRGDWILLLDDDITPHPDLLEAYVQQINLKPHALGFVGVTNFPPVMNAVTQALHITGVSTHFQRAQREEEMYWSATSNFMLNRKLLSGRRFLPELTKSTEDMEFLFRNAFENELKQYQSAPLAIVTHPWWNNGAPQTRRMFLYGQGAGEVARLWPVKQYNFYDFTTTTETLLLLMLISIPLYIASVPLKYIWYAAGAQILAEVLTNAYRAFKIGNTLNPAVIWQVTWHKNVMELGRLWDAVINADVKSFARRTDGSFRKPHPQAFRFNRLKIVKMVLFVLLFALLNSAVS